MSTHSLAKMYGKFFLFLFSSFFLYPRPVSSFPLPYPIFSRQSLSPPKLKASTLKPQKSEGDAQACRPLPSPKSNPPPHHIPRAQVTSSASFPPLVPFLLINWTRPINPTLVVTLVKTTLIPRKRRSCRRGAVSQARHRKRDVVYHQTRERVVVGPGRAGDEVG